MIRPFQRRAERATEPVLPADALPAAPPVAPNDAVNRLAGGIAHELGNLLTSILGYAELLNERLQPGSEEREDAERIVKAALRGRAITSQLSALGRERLWQPRPVALNEVVRGLASRLSEVLPGAPPIVELNSGSGSVMVDPSALEKVLLGLALSAGQSAPDADPIEIRTRPVDLDRPSAGSDPVPAGAWETVSFTALAGVSGRGGAHGPGLAVADALVTRAGGVVIVDGKGAGSRLVVFLPRARDRVPAVPANPVRTPGSTILLVEDQDHVRDVLARRLEREGYEVHQARNGAEALRRLAELGGLPDLVLTDVVMPEMGGRELAREIRGLAPELPVLFMSGYTGSDLPGTDDLPAIPDEDLLTKPFSSGELLDHVARRLQRRSA